MPKLGVGLNLSVSGVVGGGVAAAFPDVSATSAIYVNGNGPYNKTVAVGGIYYPWGEYPYGYTFEGSGNVYYFFVEYDENNNFYYYNWLVFSGSNQYVNSGASYVFLQANKWYILSGLYNGDDSYNIYPIVSTNTTATQTATTIPLSNWSPARTITAA
jgi:hypothetical protein